jgi:nucleotidyltransferase substrate binding protein (TIGR01987 family)
VEQLKDRLEPAKKAIDSLAEALAMPFSVIVRDGSIQRFEYTFEAVWKALKAHLAELEGVVCNSPKQCFREALKAGLLTIEDTELCLAMTDDRNLTSHTYIEAVAVSIFRKLPSHHAVMRRLLTAIQERSASSERQ